MVAPLAHHPLGKTGMQTASLALGTVKIGRDRGVKYPTPVTIPDDRAVLELLDRAQALGLNLLDTAPAYGNSEARLGQLLGSRRSDWLICTKVGEEFDGETSRYDFSAEHCRMSIARSLERLKTDYLDLVLIHSDGNDLAALDGGALDVLQEFKASGIIRAAGISHKTVDGARAAMARGVDVIMATLNRDYLDERELIAEAAENGCGVLIKKALASGHGSAEDLGFVAAQPGVHSIVVGTTNPAHLEENVATVG